MIKVDAYTINGARLSDYARPHFSRIGLILLVVDFQFMDTDDHPYRSPATIAPLRPVTLRPYLSISLPSERKLMKGSDRINPVLDERSAVSDERQMGKRPRAYVECFLGFALTRCVLSQTRVPLSVDLIK